MRSQDNSWAKRKLTESPEARERRLARCRAYRKAHRKELNEARREYEARKALEDPAYRERTREKNKKRARRASYRVNYGITVDEYDRMLARQHGRCAICKRKQEETRTPQKDSVSITRTRPERCASCYANTAT
jgi:hypothetical protein